MGWPLLTDETGRKGIKMEITIKATPNELSELISVLQELEHTGIKEKCSNESPCVEYEIDICLLERRKRESSRL